MCVVRACTRISGAVQPVSTNNNMLQSTVQGHLPARFVVQYCIHILLLLPVQSILAFLALCIVRVFGFASSLARGVKIIVQ